MKSSLEIAQEHALRPIAEIARENGLEDDEIELYGRYKAKIALEAIDRLSERPDAKLVCVTAITPTPAGEGKTTSSVALTQGLGHIGKKPSSACASRRSARSSASRAAPPAAATCRSCRWRT
jgi:formate--tetrahydrofolate ligase